MRELNTIVVHCSATPPSHAEVDVDVIRQWHVEGNGWSDIGYHYVITRDGSVQEGRPLHKAGAHAKGHNSDSIGICLVGGVDYDNNPDFNYTATQMIRLLQLVNTLESEYGEMACIGHRDLPDVSKACPCFNVVEFLKY